MVTESQLPEPEPLEAAEDMGVAPPPGAPSPAEEVRYGPPEPTADVTIVVPVESPDAEVRQVCDALGAELDREGRTWECIFVFDGVTGNAWDEVEKLRGERGAVVKSISFKNPFGESVCLSAAFERASGRYILTSPQYVQVDPREIEALLARLDDGADFAAPWRHTRVEPLLNRLQSSVFNLVMRRIIKAPFHDLNCYFRAIRREVLEDVAIYGDMYRFLPVIAFRQGY